MDKTYLMRHCEPHFPNHASYSVGGRTDWPLSEVGLLHAEEKAKKLVSLYTFEAIITSPMQRAIQTADPICRMLGITPIRDERLREFDLGRWDGKKNTQVQRIYCEDVYNRHKRFAHYRIPGGGDSMVSCAKRANEAVNEWSAKFKGPVLFVAHGMWIRSILWSRGLVSEEKLTTTRVDYGDCIGLESYHRRKQARFVSLDDAKRRLYQTMGSTESRYYFDIV